MVSGVIKKQQVLVNVNEVYFQITLYTVARNNRAKICWISHGFNFNITIWAFLPKSLIIPSRAILEAHLSLLYFIVVYNNRIRT